MGDPLLMTVVGVGAALTKVFLRACDAASAADLVEDGQDLFGALSRVSRRSAGSKDQIESGVSRALAARIQEMHKHHCGQDIDRQLLAGACTEVEIILNEIADDGELILSTVLNPDSLPALFHSRASQRRMNVEETAEPYFDELIEAVATQYAALVPWSTRFQIEAFKSILSGNDEIRDNSRRSLHAHEMTHEILHTVLSNLAEVTHHENKPSRVYFGSRPHVVAGNRFVERAEHEQLKAVITDPTRHRTVLLGMRGCGKTQLAASLAKQCEDANWNLVAWVNASSRESIKSDLVELAKQLKIDTSDQPTQRQIIDRCFNFLRSSGASDRLIVFDNVENIDDLEGLVPKGDGLRVVTTTTNNIGWDDEQGWGTIKVGVFDREKSINYLLTATSSTDHDAADTLAQRLGDLPLALAQAAATARNGDLSLAHYLDRLDSYGSERAIRPVPGGYYADDVATALCMAIEDALENLADPTRQYARRQLGALALLAESGVPTRWLDPTIEQQDDRELLGTNSAEDEDAHDALTELIHRSVIQQSADKATTMLHRLQAQAFRESWDENETAEAYESAAILLDKVDVDSFPRNDTDSRRRETLDLIEQLRAISENNHSRDLLTYEQVIQTLLLAFVHAEDMALSSDALALEESVRYVWRLLGTDHPYVLTARNNLAGAYREVGRLTEAIALYEQVLPDSSRVRGEDHPDTLASCNDLAGAYESAGRLTEAITLYEQILPDRIRVLGEDHPRTLTSRNNLAHAYHAAGRLTEAITLYEQVLPDSSRVLGEDHPSTLTSRNNLAGAYLEAGRTDEAIILYEQVLADRSRVLGEDHPKTLESRNNLAYTYLLMGRAEDAISHFEQALIESTRTLGEEHPLTVSTRENLEIAMHVLEQRKDDAPTD